MILNKNIAIDKPPSEYFDWSTFLITVLLVATGLISIYSATYDAGSSVFFYKQLVYAGAGIIIMFIAMFIPERWIHSQSFSFYIFSLVLLVAVLIFGKIVSGTKGWFQFGALSFQPSELAKISVIILLARFLSQKDINFKNPKTIFIILGIVALPVILIIKQPDVGSASVLSVILLGILLWAGYDIFILFFIISIPVIMILSLLGTTYFIISASIYSIMAFFFRRKFIKTFLFIIIAFTIGYLSPIIVEKLPQNSRDRIETFLNPDKDPLNKGYNVVQSMLAVGSGGFTGKGFLQGTQTQLRYIPEQRTDFIFCVPTEEFGFIGGVFVIALLTFLILRAIKIASESDSNFYSLISIGIATVFFYHTMVNIGMVIRIMPVMGIPLPFMSYGGTALIVNMGMVGLLLNIFRTHRLVKT